MSVTIGTHKMTRAELDTLDRVRDFLQQHAGDSHAGPTTSPRGDGREVAFDEVFPGHNNQNNAAKRTLARLSKLGVLKACEIQYVNGMLRLAPYRKLCEV